MFFRLLSLAFLTSLTTAVPTPFPQNTTDTNCDVSKSQFYLVTTTSPFCSSNSSNIPFVSATSLFDPDQQSNFFLRTIGPGYLSIPVFTLNAGALYTYASNTFGQGNYTYSSAGIVDGQELQFLIGNGTDSGLELVAGYMLAVGGVMDKWRLCAGDFGETVVSTFLFPESESESELMTVYRSNGIAQMQAATLLIFRLWPNRLTDNEKK